MAGLLYKDFVGIKGKKMVLLFLAGTLLFLVLRFLFPGSNASVMSGYMRETGAGEIAAMTKGDLYDSFLMLIPLIFIAAAIFLPSAWTVAILKNDDMTRTRQYIRVLPLERNAYIASKYLFIGIAVYILLSLETVWCIIFNSCAGDNSSAQLMQVMSTFVVFFAGTTLIIAAIEMPFYLTLGMKKGNLIKTGILEGLGFLAVAYLLFGDLGILDKFDLFSFVDWCKAHSFEMTLITVLTPLACLLLYWLSYRLTCHINKNREVEINE